MSRIVSEQQLKQSKQAASRNPHAAYEVGEYYRLQGQHEKAVEWYEKAVSDRKPDALALYALGYACQTGQGVPMDLVKAVHYYEAAASKGVPQACYNLAYFYQNGLGVQSDQQKAAYFSQRAEESILNLTETVEASAQAGEELQGRYDALMDQFAKSSGEWIQLSREIGGGAEERGRLEQRIDELERQLRQRDKVNRELRDRQTEYEALYVKLAAKQGELQEQLTDSLAYSRSIRAEVNETTDRHERTKELLAAEKAVTAQLNKENGRLMEQLDEDRAALLSQQRKLDEAEHGGKDLEEKLQRVETEKSLRDRSIEKLSVHRIVLAGLCVLELLAIILLIVMKLQGNGRDDGKASAIATEAKADVAREKPIEVADNASVETNKFDVEIGQIIQLGSYEQDSDAANGKEAIEWMVLERDDKTATVISRYALEARPYNIGNTEITWADCELRHWLNNDFYNFAFSSEEKSKIESVSVTDEELMPSNAQSDDATVDHVFILSRTEADKLFSSNEERVCAPTRSAMMNDAWADRETGSCWWWTRTVDPTGRLAFSVKGDGSINDRGSNITNRSGTVRPVIVIKLR